MRVFLDQIGCRLNYSEMETLASRLRLAGHSTVATAEEAQVIVFNTCAVTTDAVRGSRKQVRHFHSVNPNARIAVTGCWATLEAKEAAALPGVSLVADNEQKSLLHTLLEPWSRRILTSQKSLPGCNPMVWRLRFQRRRCWQTREVSADAQYYPGDRPQVTYTGIYQSAGWLQ